MRSRTRNQMEKNQRQKGNGFFCKVSISINTEISYTSEYEDEDMDTLYKNYEILSDFYQKHYVDLRVLDETCEPTKYPAPVIANGIVRRYERVANVLLPGKQYRQAVYGCNSGYELSERTSDSMFCQEYAWTGLEVNNLRFDLKRRFLRHFCSQSVRDRRTGQRRPWGQRHRPVMRALR